MVQNLFDLGNHHFLLCLIFTLRCLGYSFDRVPTSECSIKIVCAGSRKLVQFLSTGFRAKMQWYRICWTSLMLLDAHPYLCWLLNVFIPLSIEENVCGRLINCGIQLVLMSLKIQNIFPYSSPWNHIKPSWIHYEITMKIPLKSIKMMNHGWSITMAPPVWWTKQCKLGSPGYPQVPWYLELLHRAQQFSISSGSAHRFSKNNNRYGPHSIARPPDDFIAV